jgi:REP element-mobilizing transposase RayT
MARPLRIEYAGAIYHLCARGNARQRVFRDERDCARFVELLGQSAQRFEAAVLCFVLMGNHFHLLRKHTGPSAALDALVAVSYRSISIGDILGRSSFRAATKVFRARGAIPARPESPSISIRCGD